jgi:hypothetical protein
VDWPAHARIRQDSRSSGSLGGSDQQGLAVKRNRRQEQPPETDALEEKEQNQRVNGLEMVLTLSQAPSHPSPSSPVLVGRTPAHAVPYMSYSVRASLKPAS